MLDECEEICLMFGRAFSRAERCMARNRACDGAVAARRVLGWRLRRAAQSERSKRPPRRWQSCALRPLWQREEP